MNTELINIKGVGEKVYRLFKQKGIWNTYDLVSCLPKAYHNFAVSSYDGLNHLDTVTVIGKINAPVQTIRRKVEFTSTFIEVDGISIKLLIYGRGYLEKQLSLGDEVIVKGKFNLFLREINVSVISKNTSIPEIKPIYGIADIPDVNVSKILKIIFEEQLVDIYETLPIDLVKKYQLMPRKKALYALHFPETPNDLALAFTRLKREEAFFHLLNYLFTLAPKQKRPEILYKIDEVKTFISKLPYQLTLDQQEAVNDIYKDFKQDESSYRLIQGDVGSGKTFVAFIAALGMITAGYQVAFMAPTEILARQHFDNFKRYFNDIKACVITSSIKDKQNIIDDIKEGKYQFIFGTHVLASNTVMFDNLGLVIIDEQHKFGVEVRDQLIQKSTTKDLLYLSATPIPRSLSLTFFGDLDVSSIKQKPVIKKAVETALLKDNDFEKIIDILKETSSRNEQSFVVVPAILEANKKHSIHSVFAKLEPFFDADNLYVIHGKLKAEEIDLIMERFIDNPKGILLSTTIIEVGIDVKNATTMIIMGADNFGLSQLHQLRGRVGRGEKNGKCYLVAGKTDTERLKFLLETTDGFLLSQYDLKLRGPGIFSSILQTGNLKFNYLDLTTDIKILSEMKNDAKYYLNNLDKYPYLKKRISNKVI